VKTVYLIGSLRNPKIPVIAKQLRAEGFDIFDDWFAAGPEADDWWRTYEKAKGVSYDEALRSYAAKHVFSFDYHHLNRCDGAILVLPAGKSGHLELGYMAGQGKPTFVLFEEEPERWDVMYQFATGGVAFDVPTLVSLMKKQSTGAKDVSTQRFVYEPCLLKAETV